jgi:type IX secretion system substrate protein
MNLVSRAFFAVTILGIMIAQPVSAQQKSRIPESQQPPSSQLYNPLHIQKNAHDPGGSYNYVRPSAASTAIDGEGIVVGIMRNAYTSQGSYSNQMGYDWVNGIISVLYRGGPEEEYPNQGNGSLVINTSSDRGNTWSGTSPSNIFNEDLPGNIPGQELSARHPSIYSWNDNGTTRIATVWANIFATFLNPNGVFGEAAHKAGPIGGPYQGGALSKASVMQYFPSKIVADKNGKLYSIFQSINPDTDLLTGEYYVMNSVDNGVTWNVDYTKPAVTEASLADSYQIFSTAVTLDVSPDGSVIYVGFLGIFVEDGSFTFTDNRLGYVRSTDGGSTWSSPVMYPLYEWAFAEDIMLNTLDGWMIPSIGLVVDGLNQPHFLMTVNGMDTFFPLDSTLIGEITINPEDPQEPPEFYALAINLLPDFRRKINPRDATTGAQPTFSIWAEHAWSKDPDGMKLIAKWIDADSTFVTTPAGHASAFVRDSTHDIYVMMKDLNNMSNGARGWENDPSTNTFVRTNVTSSVGTDEKFTKINPIFNPESNDIFLLYTIMATGEFVPNEVFPDIDDIGPAELYMVSHKYAVGIDNNPEGLPEGFALEQNFPNPFNPTTTIRFSLPKASDATVKVYSMLGKELTVAYQGRAEAGTNTISYDANQLPSGQYMYRLESNGYSVTKMMTLMK